MSRGCQSIVRTAVSVDLGNPADHGMDVPVAAVGRKGEREREREALNGDKQPPERLVSAICMPVRIWKTGLNRKRTGNLRASAE